MSFLWALLFFAFFVSSSSVQLNNNEVQNYIVRIRNDLKPSSFSDVEHWYRSTLQSLSFNLQDSQKSEEVNLSHVYRTVFHGFAAELTPQQVELLKTRPEVLAIFPNQILQLHTTRSPQFLGLLNRNNAPYPLGLIKDSDYGSNVVIGVLDTGVWPESDSYKDTGLTSIPSHFKGECVEGEMFNKSHCNNKLVGARYFSKGYMKEGYNSTRDDQGHGTHTSTTAAGSEVLNASLSGYAQGAATGIARKARIAAYKICWANGCTLSDIVAAYDKAVEDGVDVISFSVGGPANLYHLDALAIAQFGAMEHGVFVSASAGNGGPYARTLCNIPPWVMTVGAGTIDRTFPADLVLSDGTVLTGESLYIGPPFPEKKFYSLVYGGNLSKSAGSFDYGGMCLPGYLDPKRVAGKIVVCQRGGGSRAMKGLVVKNATGIGMVLTNTGDIGESLIADAHLIPALSITVSAAKKLMSYLSTSKTPRARIVFRGTEVNVKPAPVVAGFSSRGPNTISDYIIKPDLIAPGKHILAAWPDNIGPSSLTEDKRSYKFNIISGTSMSCPHVSGVAALLKGAHPDWSPSRIKSALMTTSYVVDSVEKPLLDETSYNASNVWDYGSGHVDPEKAGDPGLVYDLTTDDYIDFLCASDYKEKDIAIITKHHVSCKKGMKPWDINYPSIAVAMNQSDSSKYEISVTRTVTQVSEGASSYTVSIENPPNVVITVDPPKLEFSKKEEKLSYVVKISAKRFHLEKSKPKSVFGRMTWEDGKHLVSMPIAVTQFNDGV
ncbi:hypothetical protein ACHQM5_015275 [Ranunculus cassubicifolius]